MNNKIKRLKWNAIVVGKEVPIHFNKGLLINGNGWTSVEKLNF